LEKHLRIGAGIRGNQKKQAQKGGRPQAEKRASAPFLLGNRPGGDEKKKELVSKKRCIPK